jgi:hypothetical protein
LVANRQWLELDGGDANDEAGVFLHLALTIKPARQEQMHCSFREIFGSESAMARI